MKKELGTFVLLVLLCVVLAVLNPSFHRRRQPAKPRASDRHLRHLFSIGLGIVIITGGIDLSVGSVFALLGVLLSIFLVEWHLPAAVAVLAVIGITTFLGLINGFLITKVKIQPFIVTLCGLLFYRGLARFSRRRDQRVRERPRLRNAAKHGDGKPVRHPDAVHYSYSYQRHYVGGAAPLGLRALFVRCRPKRNRREIFRYKLRLPSSASAYVLSGLLAGIAGMLLAFYTNSISPSSHGNFYELYGIAAAVLGGCSLRGGEGSIVGILIGTALLQVLQNLVNLLGIPSSLNFAVMGAVILIGVIADQLLRQRQAARAVK